VSQPGGILLPRRGYRGAGRAVKPGQPSLQQTRDARPVAAARGNGRCRLGHRFHLGEDRSRHLADFGRELARRSGGGLVPGQHPQLEEVRPAAGLVISQAVRVFHRQAPSAVLKAHSTAAAKHGTGT